jgi:hypothetical protein
MNFTTEELLAAVALHGTKAAAARALGMPSSTLRTALLRSIDRQLVEEAVPPTGLPTQGFVVKKHSITYGKQGEVTGQSIATAAAPGETPMPIPGHVIKGESYLTDADGKLLVKWTKTREGAIGAGLVEALQAAFEKFEGAAPLPAAPVLSLEQFHTIYPLVDLHLGMYSWGRETGDDYDVSIAIERARNAYQELIAGSLPSKTATLLNLGDFLHTNDQKNVTPGSGHQLDVDGRFPSVLEAGADLLLEITDLLLQKHEHVELVMLPGNHDPEVAVALRVALQLYYRKNDRVTVHNAPGLAWYRRFGKNLWGATHGHTIKQSALAGMMACDRPQDWGHSEYRAYFTGHIHHERAVEHAGVRVESFQTLASRDAYATNGGWRSGHSVQAISYHHDGGEHGRSRVNVLAKSHQRSEHLEEISA